MADDLLKRLSRIGERVSISCPDNIRGCLVFHYREAIDEIKRLRAREARLREALLHCANSIAEWERKPEGVAPFLLGALDNARAALGEEKKG